jgi:hypothetical protein
MLKFKIEQLAIVPVNRDAAFKLLNAMGAGEWAQDHVVASGEVFGLEGRNEANLAFDYELLSEAKEFEVLNYTSGPNWMDLRSGADPHRASHLGMHCTEEELEEWRKFFKAHGHAVAQEVFTESHTNPVIKDERRYHYVIFDTYYPLGIDIKFIVRRPVDSE